jgi:hypothetical protein
VACFSEDLGEWTAAQITDLNPEWKTAGVLELDWSGAEPHSVADIGQVSPLVLTHHAWAGKPAHTNYAWVLPRRYKVIGTLPPMVATQSNSYSTGWNVGMQLAMQRRWDRGDREARGRPGELKLTVGEFKAATDVERNIWRLRIEGIDTVDCAEIVRAFPKLHSLSLYGELGCLENAGLLNQLSRLTELAISDLFGMTMADCLLPRSVPALEWLALHSIPRDYGAAMRSAWAPEVPNGCLVAITGLRSTEWLAENLDNPLRDWDGREHITAAKFRKSVAQYKATRRAVLATLANFSGEDRGTRLVDLGREFGEAFNKLSSRDDFIETEEREELFTALAGIPAESPSLTPEDVKEASDRLTEGCEAVRDW